MVFSLIEAMRIDTVLKQNGIDRNLRILDQNFCNFSLEQLNEIEEVVIEGSNDISFLKKLPNLKKLTIQSLDYSLVLAGGQYQNNTKFNQISDFSIINELQELEYLCIKNDICIEHLDVRKLEKLKKVYLSNNPNLKRIDGLDLQHHLEEVIMYGNNIDHFSNIKKYLENTIDTRKNILDVSTFFTFIHSIEDAKQLYDMDLQGRIHVKFSEKNGFVDYTELTINQITSMYIKFRRLFEQKELMKADASLKIAYVFRYVTEYIKFASGELEQRQQVYNEILDSYDTIPEFYKKNLGYLHSSFTTYHFRSGNCEGIVNLMRFMLSILNIPTENVHVHDKRFHQNIEVNHALLRANENGQWRYYDPTYNRRNLSNFFNKTFDEISIYVNLSEYERIISEGEDYEFRKYYGTNFTK